MANNRPGQKIKMTSIDELLCVPDSFGTTEIDIRDIFVSKRSSGPSKSFSLNARFIMTLCLCFYIISAKTELNTPIKKLFTVVSRPVSKPLKQINRKMI